MINHGNRGITIKYIYSLLAKHQLSLAQLQELRLPFCVHYTTVT